MLFAQATRVTIETSTQSFQAAVTVPHVIWVSEGRKGGMGESMKYCFRGEDVGKRSVFRAIENIRGLLQNRSYY